MPFTIVQAAPTVNAVLGIPVSAPLTVTLGSPTTAGNTLVACITAGGTTTAPTVSGITLGGAAGNWQAAVTDASNVSIFGGAVWYDPNCAGGQTSVVVSFTGGAGTGAEAYCAVYEVSGQLVFDKGNHGDSASSAATWTSNATATTTAAAEIFFGACTASGAIPAVTGAGTWTTQNTGVGTWDQVAGYQIVASTGTATFSGTAGGTSYAAVVATFSGPAVTAATAAPAGAGTVTAAAAQAAKAALAGAGAVNAAGQITGTATLAAAGSVTAKTAQAAGSTLAAAGTVTAASGLQAPASVAAAGQVTAVSSSTIAFTVGTLTASDAPGGSGGVLTASDQRTGGPGG